MLMLSAVMPNVIYVECHYAECHYAECCSVNFPIVHKGCIMKMIMKMASLIFYSFERIFIQNQYK